MLERFKKGAEKAGMQATAFLKEGSSKAASESRGFVQGFSLPGESEKAAKILESFLGEIHSNSELTSSLILDQPSCQPTQITLNRLSTPSRKQFCSTHEVSIFIFDFGYLPLLMLITLRSRRFPSS